MLDDTIITMTKLHLIILIIMYLIVILAIAYFIGCTPFSPWVTANNGEYLFGRFCR